MPTDPYAALRALLRAEAARTRSRANAQLKDPNPQESPEKRDR